MRGWIALGIVAAYLLASPMAPSGGQGEGPARMHAMQVRGPASWNWTGEVQVPPPYTVLDQLEAARAMGLRSTVERQALGAYVAEIGGFHEDRTGGWNYCVRAAAAWRWVGLPVDGRALAPGEQVAWVWVTDGGNTCGPLGSGSG